MATFSFTAYEDAWGTGTPYTITVPRYTPYGNGLIFDSGSLAETEIDTVIRYLDEYVEYIPRTSTVFAYNDAAIEYYASLGFTNIIRLEYGEHRFYVDNIGSYLKVQPALSESVTYANSGVYSVYTPSLSREPGGQWQFLNYNPDVTNVCTWASVSPTSQKYPYRIYISGRTGTVDDNYTLTQQFWRDVSFEEVVDDDDPYKNGGISDVGGGTGTFSGTGDSINFPSLPTLSAVSTGFITLFKPSIGEMQNLASYMWSDAFDIEFYKKIFADPMDCILGCSIVPVAVPSGGSKAVTVGNISTGVSMTLAASQYVEVDCGTLNVEEYWGSYLDYDPYTKAEIYLPYCGTHALQVDDIMGKAVHVKYHVDILSGACCAYVQCGGSVMYSFVGQCSSSIPITANDWTNVINGALSIAASVGVLAATGGTAAPAIAGAGFATAGTIFGGGIKQNVEKSGSMGGTGGMLGVQTPYLILTRPRQALPKKQNTYTGYPSFITTKLEDLKGYTEIETIRITGVPATNAELSELESILKSGVIF